MSKYCAIVKDLMWQYTEGECSPETKAFIEEHINECEDCRKLFESIKKTDELVSETVAPEPIPEEKILKKGFKKIRKRFVISTLALILIVPIVFCSILLSNEIKKEGICYSNIDEIAMARKFVTLLEKSEYGKAAKMLDFSDDYYSILDAKEELGKTWYDDAVIVDKSEDVYAISGYFAEILKRDGNTSILYDFSETAFWRNVMVIYPTEAFIPERIWNEIVTDYYETQEREGIAFVPTKINGIECEGIWPYYRYETECGVYYSVISQAIGSDLIIDAPMIIGRSSIVNKEVYDSAREYIEDNAENAKDSFLQFYEIELGMTVEEYNTHRRDDFVKRMNVYSSRGYELDYKKVKDAYRRDGWIIEIICTESRGNENLRFTFELRIANGRIINIYSKESTHLSNEILGKVIVEQ